MLALLIVSVTLTAIIVVAALRRRTTQEELRRDGITGAVLYTDADGKAKTLVSHRHQLCGKPDYVVQEDGRLIPVEKKTRDCRNGKPFLGEALQVAAYCLILEDLSGTKVRRGRLQFNNRTIDVPFDEAMRATLTQVLADMRQCSETESTPRSHNSPAKCGACEYNATCPDSLARNVLRFA